MPGDYMQKIMKKIIFVTAIFTCFILLLGCVDGGDNDKPDTSSGTGQQGVLNQSNKTQSNMSAKDTIKMPMKPFYFKAQFSVPGENELFITEYYFEKEMDCFGRKAYVGLNRFASSDPLEEQEYWRKITLYLDNYSMGVSGYIEKNSLVFDDAKEVKWFELTEIPNEQDCIPGTLDFITTYFNKNE